MKIVSCIPARGGSKGIPRKNLQLINNKPLIAYSIEASLFSIIDETWVSTDDHEIGVAAIKYGAQLLARPRELAKDNTSSEDVLLHFADNIDFDILVFLQCTSPLTNYHDINTSIGMIGTYDSVISVCTDHGGRLCGGFNWKLNDNDNGIPCDYTLDKPRPRRQDMDVRYRENGAIYITSKDALLKSKNRISGNIGLYIMSRDRSFEIDNEKDLEEIRTWLRMY